MHATTINRAESLTFERLPAVCKRVGFAQSTLYRWIEQGRFPAPIKIGYSNAWDSRVVDSWMLDQITQAEKQSAEAAWAA